MARRLELHALLLTFADNVYFQPPANVRLTYPCIIYVRDSQEKDYADNGSWQYIWRYQLTIIDQDPDSIIVEKISALPMCSFVSHFVTENLPHDVFSLYF